MDCCRWWLMTSTLKFSTFCHYCSKGASKSRALICSYATYVDSAFLPLVPQSIMHYYCDSFTSPCQILHIEDENGASPCIFINWNVGVLLIPLQSAFSIWRIQILPLFPLLLIIFVSTLLLSQMRICPFWPILNHLNLLRQNGINGTIDWIIYHVLL